MNLIKINLAKRIISWAIFVVVLLFSLNRLGFIIGVWGAEYDDVDRRDAAFFYLPRNTVDVLFLGNSHIYCSFNPKQLYDEYGIVSAELSTSAQSLQNSYYLLKEALKRQSPQLVIIDYSTISNSVDEGVKNFRLHFTSGISQLPDISFNKYQEFAEIKKMNYGYSNQVKLSDVVSFLEYRNDYERENCNLKTFGNIIIDPASEYTTLGYYPTQEVYMLDSISPGIESDNFTPMEETVEYEYFSKIYELCKENEIQLIMVRSLYNRPDFDDYGIVTQFEKYMDSNSIPYIDFFDIYEELDIDFSTDFRDEDHLNIYGAKKATSYLGQYLNNNYNLQDGRGNKKYEFWDEVGK